jgi:hypothetical protein
VRTLYSLWPFRLATMPDNRKPSYFGRRGTYSLCALLHWRTACPIVYSVPDGCARVGHAYFSLPHVAAVRRLTPIRPWPVNVDSGESGPVGRRSAPTSAPTNRSRRRDPEWILPRALRCRSREDRVGPWRRQPLHRSRCPPVRERRPSQGTPEWRSFIPGYRTQRTLAVWSADTADGSRMLYAVCNAPCFVRMRRSCGRHDGRRVRGVCEYLGISRRYRTRGRDDGGGGLGQPRDRCE